MIRGVIDQINQNMIYYSKNKKILHSGRPKNAGFSNAKNFINQRVGKGQAGSDLAGREFGWRRASFCLEIRVQPGVSLHSKIY